MRTSISALICLLPLVACTSEAAHDHEHDTHAPAAVADGPQAAGQHAVICGCEIPEVHHCSEWVDVDGEWVALELPTDMGSMPFCGKEGLQAQVEGEIVDGTYVASSFELVGE